ncbi:excalibur calcium-binding domain-containing protein [Micromonospora musae]|uniref:excalibur calcium-binding domain-containing protein n=1 Tax=Micromonospora musae TaxID=1894970 RepID=UPI0033DDA681
MSMVVISLLCCGGALAGFIAGDSPEPDASATAGSRTEPAQAAAAPIPSEPSASPTVAATSAKPSPSKLAPSKASPTAVHYRNCDAVRAAGRDPLLAGEPGYRAGLDRDGDGVACESDGARGDDREPAGGDTGGDDSGGGDTGDGDDTDPRFSTCAKAKAAGYGPYRRGVDPEYHWYQDRDGDGTVCE